MAPAAVAVVSAREQLEQQAEPEQEQAEPEQELRVLQTPAAAVVAAVLPTQQAAQVDQVLLSSDTQTLRQ